MTAKRRVVIAYKSLPAYRRDFFEGLHDSLRADGIVLDLVHGEAEGADLLKRDTVLIPWAIQRTNRSTKLFGRKLLWQPIRDLVDDADLVIVEQASKLLINYWLLANHTIARGPRVALWGHGANLQTHTASRVSEALKRRYSTLPHWWFAYTDDSKQRVCKLGFPPERITVVQNAIDTRGLQHSIQNISAEDLDSFRERHRCVAGATGLFIGSLYSDKRIGFLLRAAEAIHRHDPRFVLLIAGDGEKRVDVEHAQNSHNFIRYLGRVDGPTRSLALRAADVLLMPGLVGLGILDSFAAEAPLVTTAVDYHSPEIEYLRHGQNGLCTPDPHDLDAYASAVLTVLEKPALARHLRNGCRTGSERFTNEEMVRRFRGGILEAIGPS